MESAVSYMELLFAIGSAIAAAVGGWIHMRINVSALTQKLEYLEREIQEEKDNNKENHNDISKKVEKIFSVISEIKVMIAENNRK